MSVGTARHLLRSEPPMIAIRYSYRFARGNVLVERRNRGYSLYHAESGAPIARLRPNADDGCVEVLYWSLWKERWSPAGPFGRTVLPLDEALRFVACEDIFWALI